jgi:hypothetical protein
MAWRWPDAYALSGANIASSIEGRQALKRALGGGDGRVRGAVVNSLPESTITTIGTGSRRRGAAEVSVQQKQARVSTVAAASEGQARAPCAMVVDVGADRHTVGGRGTWRRVGRGEQWGGSGLWNMGSWKAGHTLPCRQDGVWASLGGGARQCALHALLHWVPSLSGDTEP